MVKEILLELTNSEGMYKLTLFHILTYTSLRFNSVPVVSSNNAFLWVASSNNAFLWVDFELILADISKSKAENIRKFVQKQPSRGVLMKRCSENMQQMYRRTSVRKCDFNKVTKQLYWNHTSAWVFYCKFAAYFQNTFS